MTAPSLRAPVQLVSPRARWYWFTRALLGWIVVGAAEMFIWPAFWRLHGGLIAVPAVTLAIAVAHLAVMPQWRYRVHRWEATDTAVYTQAGWFTQERRIAPVARIQTVETQRGLIEQVFRLANVTVTTASAAGPLKIHGLARAVADDLANDLTVRTQSAGGDGT